MQNDLGGRNLRPPKWETNMMKVMKEGEAVGRKFISLIISFGLLLVGFLSFHFLKMDIKELPLYETYAKWVMIGLAIFVSGNGAITVVSLIMGKKVENGSNENLDVEKSKDGGMEQ